MTIDGREVPCSLLTGEQPPESEIQGPALIALPDATLFVRPGWSGNVDGHGTIALEYADG